MEWLLYISKLMLLCMSKKKEFYCVCYVWRELNLRKVLWNADESRGESEKERLLSGSWSVMMAQWCMWVVGVFHIFFCVPLASCIYCWNTKTTYCVVLYIGSILVQFSFLYSLLNQWHLATSKMDFYEKQVVFSLHSILINSIARTNCSKSGVN